MPQTDSLIAILSPLYPPTQRALHARYRCANIWPGADDFQEIESIASRVEVLVTHSGRGVDAAGIARLPALGLVACFGVGVDAIDLAACRARGIRVSNTPGVLSDDVADMAMALLLALQRRIVVADRFVRDARWPRGPMPMSRSLTGSRVGIIGLGRIGTAIARRCQAFGTEIAYQGPREKPALAWRFEPDLVALARWADVLIAACPGGTQTRGIVSREVLAALGSAGVFINIARGSVVDEAALVEMLGDGRLGGAGLDVFADEPRVPEALCRLESVVLSPHHGSGTDRTRGAMGELVLANIEAHLSAQPLPTPVI